MRLAVAGFKSPSCNLKYSNLRACNIFFIYSAKHRIFFKKTHFQYMIVNLSTIIGIVRIFQKIANTNHKIMKEFTAHGTRHTAHGTRHKWRIAAHGQVPTCPYSSDCMSDDILHVVFPKH